MKKAAKVLLYIFLGMFFGVQGSVLAEEDTNAADASVEEMKATEASLAGLPDDTVPIDEEIKDEEVIDTDA